MKRNYAYLKATILSFTLLFGLEYALIVLFGDYQYCFWHNSILGNILTWSVRAILFFVSSSVLSSFFQPAFKTLRDRMIEKQERNSNKTTVADQLTLDTYYLKQAR